jgi:hypothetical protein
MFIAYKYIGSVAKLEKVDVVYRHCLWLDSSSEERINRYCKITL